MFLDQLLPPPELIGHASGSLNAGLFVAAGAEYLNYARDLAGLKPEHRVLDLGCGCGRMALAMLRYLSRAGSYDGIDVDSPSIEWAREHISAHAPNFRFQRADVANATYNPHGAIPAHRYRLPFPAAHFDFVLLTSVFTHMLPRAVDNYVAEVARVLRPGGKCLATLFLLNDRSSELIRAGRAVFQFPNRSGVCAVQHADRPEDVVGYDEPAILRLLRSNRLALHRPVAYGKWSGRNDGIGGFQDIVVAKKRHSASVVGWLWNKIRPRRADRLAFVPEPNFTRAAA